MNKSSIAVRLISAGLIPPSLKAQVRFVDRTQTVRVQTQSQAPDRWAPAIRNVQEGRVSVGRRMKKDASSQPGSGLNHDVDLAMPHWTSTFTSQGITYPFTVIGSDPSLGTSTTIPTVIVPYRLIFPDGAASLANLQQVYFPGSLVTIPVKMNDDAQIVGLYIDKAGAQHGFLLSKGQYSTIDFPGAVATEALSINNWPVPAIAGDYVDALGTVRGFVSVGGQFLPIDANFASNFSVNGFNDLGQMTGTCDVGTAQTFGFTGVAGWLTTLNFPNISDAPITTSTFLNSLNNKGEIAGTARIQFPNYVRMDAFLEGGGNFEPLEGGLDGFLADQALGINDAGFMVGSFQDLAGVHAAIAIPARLYSSGAAMTSTTMKIPLPFPLQ